MYAIKLISKHVCYMRKFTLSELVVCRVDCTTISVTNTVTVTTNHTVTTTITVNTIVTVTTTIAMCHYSAS